MFRFFALFLPAFLLACPASAAQCSGDFQTFLAAMARDAQAAGVSRAVIDQAFAGVTSDPAVLN
ncbi:MAG: lytic transglycosylase, partial [Pseudolabrys sp.]